MKRIIATVWLTICAVLLLASLSYGAAATVEQGNADLSSASLTVTLNANREVEIYWIGVSFTDGAGTITATSETVTFTLVDETDSDYNLELYREVLTSERGAYWMPDGGTFRVNKTQQVVITVTNGNATNYAFGTISYKPL